MNGEPMEAVFVHETYESIADHFSRTRHRMWPQVSRFLATLPAAALVLDAGCGNGKYLSARSDIACVGLDRARALLDICAARGHEVVRGDCVRLPVRDNLFDAVLSIAVLHHLDSEDRRLAALQSISTCLSRGGRALIYVWAFEQRDSQYVKRAADPSTWRQEHGLPVHENGTQFRAQDTLVPFKSAGGEKLRFYHVFREGELEALLARVPDLHVEESYWDSGNWAVRVRRM